MKKICLILMGIIIACSSVASAKKGLPSLDHQTPQLISCVDPSNTNELEMVGCDSDGTLHVNIVSSSGQYEEDSVHVTADIGNFILAVRNDILASLVGTDGDYSPLQVNALGALFVEVSSSSGQFAEDAQHTSGDIGSQMLTVRNDVLAALATTDGDYAPLQVDDKGALYVSASIDLAVHSTPFAAAGPQVMFEAADIDGSSMPNTAVIEGDAVRGKASAEGIHFTTLVNEDGGGTPIVTSNTAIGSGLGNVGVVTLGETFDFDGLSIQAGATQGNALRQAFTSRGIPYTFLTIQDGSSTPTVTDQASQITTPAMMNVGGEYRNAPVTYTDGDAAILQMDVNGLLYVNTGNVAIDDDGGSWAVSTGRVAMGGFLADEATPDSVDEGDVGAARMTLDRKLHIASTQVHDDAASNYASMGGLFGINFDGTASPFPVGAEGDVVRSVGTLSGIQEVMLVNSDGSDYGQIKGYDSGNDAMKGFEISPLSSHHVEETLLDLTNIAQTTTAYGYIDMDGYRNFAFQCETSDATPTDVLTVTIEASIQDDGTAADGCAYQDITNAFFGVASWVDTDFFAISDTVTPLKYVRIKYVTSTGGGNDADLTCYSKRLY